MTWRTKPFDYDARPEPKTEHFCIMCQKDLQPGQPFRIVHQMNGGADVLHPSEWERWAWGASEEDKGGDLGEWPIGPDCARKLGLEWSVPEEGRWNK